MILGTISIDAEQGAVHTHRDSYLIETLSVVRAITGGETALLDARDQGFFTVEMPEFWQRPEMDAMLRNVTGKPDKYAWLGSASPAPLHMAAPEAEDDDDALNDILRRLRGDEGDSM